MREKHAIPEKEWLFFRNGMVNEFFDRLHSFPTDLQAVVTMTTSSFRKSPGHPMGESTVPVTPFPPFSALVAEITTFAEKLGQGIELVEIGYELGPALVVKFGTALGVLGRWIVSRYAMPMGEMPGRQSCQGWTTKGSRNISALEDNALPGQLVKICLLYTSDAADE